MIDEKINAYDISRWNENIYRYDSFNNALESGLSCDGIHSIRLAKNQPLDICIKETKRKNNTKEQKVMMIGLSGAISSRNGKKAPFFSGLSIAKSLDLPIASISDPTLALDNNLPLAWYSGNENSLNLPIKLAKILERLADIYKTRLLIFGGSGGGYAALMLASLIKCNASVLVWNPQTSISEYAPGFVKDYLDVAFPRILDSEDHQGDSSPKALREIMNSLGIFHNLLNSNLGSNIELVYLQNQTDWHVSRHAGPYINSKTSWKRNGNATFYNKNNKFIISFGEWGEGHAIPPKNLIELILRKLAEGVSIKEISRSLDSGIEGILDTPKPLVWFNTDKHLQLETQAFIDGPGIRAQVTIKPTRNWMNHISYAFYLLKDNKRIAQRWYGPDKEAFFSMDNLDGKLEVIAFAQDQLGSKLINRSSVTV